MLQAASAGQAMLHPGATFPPSLGYRPAGFWGAEIEGSDADGVKFDTAGWNLYLSEDRKTLPLVHTGEDVDITDDKTGADKEATRLWGVVGGDAGAVM